MEGKEREEIYEEKPETAGAEEPAEETADPGDGTADASGVTGTAQNGDGTAAEEGKDAGPAGETESGGEEEKTDEDGADDSQTSDSDEEEGPAPASDGKWHVFGKKKEKKDPKDQKIEDLTDQLKRQMAEFDNFRKRTEKEKSAMFEVGARSIIEKMLPVIDNFGRGLATVPEDAKGTPFAEGMDMIYKQLLKNLEEAGVKPIEAVGQPFDPNFHNAVMHVEDENLGENVVAQEFQKGYIYRDTVVRHSMVQVAN